MTCSGRAAEARQLVEQRLATAGQPLRVILDSALRTPPSAKTLALDGAVKIFALSTAAAKGFPQQAEVIAAPACGERVEPGFVLHCLASRFGCNEVLLEAGPALAGALLAARLVDEFVVYVGARLLGSDALPALQFHGADSLAQSVALDIADVRGIGTGLKVTARPKARQGLDEA